jgi:hypothetical protein
MFMFDPTDDPLSGVFSYIVSKESNWKDIIETTASSNSEISWHTVSKPSNVYSFTTELRGGPQNIKYSLGKSLALNITSYTMRNSANPPNGIAHLKSWDFLGSVDNRGWMVLDRNVNSSLMNGNYIVKNIKVQTSGIFRYFKLVQTGPGFTSEFGFYLNKIELFGTLYNHYSFNTCNQQNKYKKIWMNRVNGICLFSIFFFKNN